MFTQLIDTARPFALLEKNGVVSCYQGEFFDLQKLDDIHELARRTSHDIVFVLPYRIIQERGFAAKGSEPILAIAVERSCALPKLDFINQLERTEIELVGDVQESLSDEAYAALIHDFQQNEIEQGNASQATLSRSFTGKIKEFNAIKALTLYGKALAQEGQYMTVLFANISDEQQFIVGCTPERHLEIRSTETLMTPIAGTLRKEGRVDFKERLLTFLSDPKEINELFQVVDEELKMMGVICPDGGEVQGPFLREVGAVVHTEYQLVGKRSVDTIKALRNTLHAPTVVGSPMASAARIIEKYESESRRYYAGEIGLYRCPRTEAATGDLDCSILIRCTEIQGDGTFRVQAGGGLVRDSDPMSEAYESRAKAMGLLGILTKTSQLKEKYLSADLLAEVMPLLTSRNKDLSAFWMLKQIESALSSQTLAGIRMAIINNEDDFAFMLEHIFRVMGANVQVFDTFEAQAFLDDVDLVIIGPGPGDPTNMKHPRMKLLQDIISGLNLRGVPILGVCLGHQALAVSAGIEVKRQNRSTQGVQLQVRVMDQNCRLGFYNSFAPVYSDGLEQRVGMSFDLDAGGRVIALYSPTMIGFQFHPESIMSENGVELLYQAVQRLVPMPRQASVA